MLSLWKLRVGTEAYYLAQVATGLDDYYTGAGEAPGRWAGGGSGGLGLSGEVAGEDLRATMAGLAPGTGLTPNGAQLRPHPRRVPGFDLTFAAPKSVSVLYALGDARVQIAVVDACEAAVADALGWLEREACFVRRGTNNRAAKVAGAGEWGTRRMATRGFVAARFRHRTSRAGDPHLHWHVLVANLAQGIDGRWSALDGQGLYRAKRAAGVVFQTALRAELTRRLGLEWGPVHQDAAEVAGVPRRVLSAFSTRRAEIEAWMDERGRTGPAAADEAMAATRRAKAGVEAAALEADWKRRAGELGWGPDDLERLLAGSPAPAAPPRERWVVRRRGVDDDGRAVAVEVEMSFGEWVAELAGERLTAHHSSFSRLEVTQAVAAALGAGADSAEVERLVRRVLAHPHLVPLAGGAEDMIDLGDRRVGDDGAGRWSSRELLEVEAAYLGRLRAGLGGGRGVLSPGAAAAAVRAAEAASPGVRFGADQVDAVVRLCTQGNAVEVLVGRAGTGKTTALRAVGAAYRADGSRVLGLAPSARAARELAEGAGISAQTIARFRLPGSPWQVGLGPDSVVVVDEAGMAATRDLAFVVAAVDAAGGKVILVGDHHQLPEVGAGGAFRAAVEHLGEGACELAVNRRQVEAWERAALDELRHGDVHAAWHAYRDHGRVVLLEGAEGLHERVVADWWAQREEGRDVFLLAGTRAEAAALNRRARAHMAAAGRLGSPELCVGERRFALGDRVVLLRNDPDQRSVEGTPVAVDNGMVGDVVGIDAASGALTVAPKGSGDHVVLDAGYLEAGFVDHGYALTIHKSQGATCDAVLVVGPAGLYREGAYVALSRARHSAQLYATVAQAAEVEERHARGIPLPAEGPDDAEAEILARLERSAAKVLASAVDPDAVAVARLADDHPAAELVARARHARAVERRGPKDPAEAEARLARARAARSRLATGRRVRALDRDNVGAVAGIDDEAGTATVGFVAESGAQAERRLRWDQLVVIDRPDPVDISAPAAATLAGMEAEVEPVRRRWAAYLERHGLAPGDATRLGRAARLALDRAGDALRAAPPGWLTWWLGPRPADQVGALVWDDAVGRLGAWRASHGVSPDVAGLGPCPADEGAGASWRRESLRLLDTRAWLAGRGGAAPVPPAVASPGQLAARRGELEALVALAPPDQSRIVDQLLARQLAGADLHAELAQAAAAQAERKAWILEHWAHVVELEQLTRLLGDRQALSHWPAVVPPEVAEVLARLADIAPLEAPEHTSLAKIYRRQRDADPLRRLEARLATLDARLAALEAELAGPGLGEDQRGLLRDAVSAAGTERDGVVAELGHARQRGAARAILAAYGAGEPDAVAAARRRRVATVAHEARTAQPPWVVAWVSQLHDAGRLGDVSVDEVARAVAAIAAYRDRWGVSGDEPLGPRPADVEQRFAHEQLEAALAAPLAPVGPDIAGP